MEGQLVTKGKVEDISESLRRSPLRNAYWENKRAHPEWINVPIYAVGSWTNPVHTPNTFKAWSQIHPKVPKWLRVHDSMEWPDSYDHQSKHDLKRFFDYYLHGIDNGWPSTPAVRLSVLQMGLKDIVNTINRPESEFPLARTRYTKYYLQSDHSLSLHPPQTPDYIKYNSTDGEKSIFEFRFNQQVEATGYFMAHLNMSSAENHSEMDVFVQVESLSSRRRRQGSMCIRPGGTAQTVLKVLHDWQIGLGTVGMAFSWGPEGQLRASHALSKAPNSHASEPEYMLWEARKPLNKGECRALDVPLRPYGQFWQAGEILQLIISGSKINPPALSGMGSPKTENEGHHIIHTGGFGQDSSYLLIPEVE